MVMTIIAMSGAFITPAKAAASAGDLIKMAGNSSVYYLGSDSKRYVFPNEATYFSWYKDFSGVITIPATELQSYMLGGNVTMRPGTKLVKIVTDPSVYAVEPNGVLRKIASEADAIALYGSTWATRVVDVADSFFTNYTVGSPLTSNTYPKGSLLKNASSANIYYYDGTNYRLIASDAAFTANRFNNAYVVTTSMTLTAGGTSITAAETGITNTAQAGGTGPIITGSGLTVALAADQPVSATYVRDTGAIVSQAVAPFLKLNFTAASDGPVTVNTLRLTRSGISADSDLGTVYIYDGETMLAEHTSLSNRVITFNNSNGLFVVPAGTTKTITVKADIAAVNATVSGIVLGVNAASDITSTGATVSGSFPINGNSMAVGTVTDLGYVNVTGFTTCPATIDPGKTNEEIWRFSATANDQNMSIKYLKMTVVGTVAVNDLANFKLEVGGVQVGSTVASMNASKEVIFDLSAAPYQITSGQTKVFTLKADVLNGSSRAFKVTIRKVGDFITTDNNYGVQVKPLKSGAAFALIEPTTGAGTTINSGTLTVSVASDSPTGNIPAGSNDVSLAKFTYKANGEDIKVTSINVSVNEENGDKALKNGKLYWNGSQVGSTDTSVADETTVVYTLSQVIPAGQTATIEYKADTIDDTNTNLVSGQTIVVSLVAGTTDATGQSSLNSVSTAAATARTLTVASGLVVASENLSMANYSATTPTGVVGATNVKVASVILTAGSGEGVTVNQIVVGDDGDDTTEDFGDNFQNLVPKNSAGTALATVQGTLAATAGADYTFTLSPAVVIPAGQQYVVDFYADILTGATGFGGARPGLEFVNLSATGNTTSSDAYPSASVADLQDLYIAANGSLTVTADADTPTGAQIVLGQTDVELAKLKFTAGASENVNINRIALTDTSSAANSLTNVRLYDGTNMVGSSVAAFNAATNGVATWNLVTPLVITKNTSKTLTVKADINAYPNGTSASTHVINLASNANIDSIGASSGAPITETVTSATGNTMTAYRTKVSVSKDATSPSGAPTATTDQTVLVFNVTNTSNVDNQDATVKDLALNLSTSGTWLTATTRNIKVYKNTITAGNLVGTKAFAPAAALASVAFDGWDTTTSLTDVSVANGSSVKFIVTVDTNEAPTDGRLTVSIPSSNGIKWTDGVTANIVVVDSLPLNGGTLTY